VLLDPDPYSKSGSDSSNSVNTYEFKSDPDPKPWRKQTISVLGTFAECRYRIGINKNLFLYVAKYPLPQSTSRQDDTKISLKKKKISSKQNKVVARIRILKTSEP